MKFQLEGNDHSKIFNTHLILDDKGHIKSIYDKIHLFEANIKNGDVITSLKESDYTLPGEEFFCLLKHLLELWEIVL